MLTGKDFDYHCHSNLTRAVLPFGLAESDVHDVLNVFQVTGLDRQGKYFMYVPTTLITSHRHCPTLPDFGQPHNTYVHRQPSPAKPSDFFEFFAEIDILCALSTCPGGDLSAWEFGESEGEGKGKVDMLDTCRPLGVEVFEIVNKSVLKGWKSPECPAYKGVHGLGMPVFGRGI